MRDTLVANVPFYMTPNAVYDLGLSEHELVVFCYLCRCANNGSVAFPSYSTIAECCGISRRTAIRAVAGLFRKNLITKEPYHGAKTFGSNRYTVSNLSDFIGASQSPT